MKHFKLLTILALLVFLSNCKKEEIDKTTTTANSQVPETVQTLDNGALISTSITGLITDENGDPLADATVTLLNSSTVTDEDGRFRFINAQAYEKQAYVKVQKSGYFLGSRSIIPSDGINTVSIKMLKANIVGRFNAVEGGEITFDNVNIAFGTSFTRENGQPYEGDIVVRGSYLDPEAEDLNEIMPGSLRGADQGEESLLVTFGMIAIELEDDAGNKLQIAEGNSAEISMPIAASQAGSAPERMPLWHFDEELGYWIKEGEAEKVGNKYVGIVNHFSFWNCDVPMPYSSVNGKILNTDRLSIPGALVTIQSATLGRAFSYTDSDGKFGGFVPANERLKLRVYSPANTHFVIHSSEIGPFSEGQEQIGDVVIEENFFTTVSGIAVDCNGDDFEGFLETNQGTVPVKNGEFTLQAFKQSELQMRLVNSNGEIKGKRISVEIKNADVQLGTLNYCFRNQGEWISEFTKINYNYFSPNGHGGDELHEFYTLTNCRILEDVNSSLFQLKADVAGARGEVIDSIFIQISESYQGPDGYAINKLKNKIDFPFKSIKTSEGLVHQGVVKNQNYILDLTEFDQANGDIKISLQGVLEVILPNGNDEPRYVSLEFDAEI